MTDIKINKIILNNFRAFYGKTEFDIGGKNCLIYGENGSGKSSLYHALKIFVDTSIKDENKNIYYKRFFNIISDDYQMNIFSYDTEELKRIQDEVNSIKNDLINSLNTIDKKKYKKISPLIKQLQENIFENIQISITKIENKINKNKNSENEDIFDIVKQNINKLNNILEIVKEKTNKFNTNFFVKIEFDNEKEILLNSDTKRTETNKSFLQYCYNVNPFIKYKKLLRVYTSTDFLPQKINIYPMLEVIFRQHPKMELQNISKIEKIEKILENIKFQINNFIKKFDENIIIEGFEFKEDKSKKRNECYLKIKFHDKPILKYHLFLNEARLSAIALSIYFASIKELEYTLMVSNSSVLKILVLDDLLIGLDMGNRLKVWEILNKDFKNYQIFFMTYDKVLFDTLITVTKSRENWNFFEFYQKEEVIGENKFEIPIVMRNNYDYYEKAKIYAARIKNDNDDYVIDYEICANYLRKECERLLKEKLIGKYKFEFKDDGTITFYDQIKDLWKMFLLQIKNTKDIGSTIMNELDEKYNEVSKVIFNPFSHDNPDKPLFKKDIDTAFEFIDKLKTVYILVKKINKGDKIIYEKGIDKFEIEATENIKIIKSNEDIIFDGLFKINKYFKNNQEIQDLPRSIKEVTIQKDDSIKTLKKGDKLSYEKGIDRFEIEATENIKIIKTNNLISFNGVFKFNNYFKDNKNILENINKQCSKGYVLKKIGKEIIGYTESKEDFFKYLTDSKGNKLEF